MVEPTQNGGLIPGWRVEFCPKTPKSLKPLVVSGQNSKFTHIGYRVAPGILLIKKMTTGFPKMGAENLGWDTFVSQG